MKASEINEQGKEVFSFGKFIGKAVKWVLLIEPLYIIWVKTKTKREFSPEFEREIKRIKLL
jgi:hypothetical protein